MTTSRLTSKMVLTLLATAAVVVGLGLLVGIPWYFSLLFALVLGAIVVVLEVTRGGSASLHVDSVGEGDEAMTLYMTSTSGAEATSPTIGPRSNNEPLATESEKMLRRWTTRTTGIQNMGFFCVYSGVDDGSLTDEYGKSIEEYAKKLHSAIPTYFA